MPEELFKNFLGEILNDLQVKFRNKERKLYEDKIKSYENLEKFIRTVDENKIELLEDFLECNELYTGEENLYIYVNAIKQWIRLTKNLN